MDLSILIPSRNEMFLAKTIENILENIEGNTEIIAGLDGAWSDPSITDDPRVTILYYPESIGQRAMTNKLCKLSKAKYIMKVDAHCAFDKGFDVKMMNEMKDDWTMIPLMKNLHAFDLVCEKCGERRYQSPSGPCKKCGGETKMDVLWRAKPSPNSTSYRFDKTLHFQYHGQYKNSDEYKFGLIVGFYLSFDPSRISSGIVSLLSDLASSHQLSCCRNLSWFRKNVSPDAVSFPPIDDSRSIGSIEINLIRDKLKVVGVATPPVVTNMVNDKDVLPSPARDTTNEPRIDEAMCECFLPEVSASAVSAFVNSSNPIPASGSIINSDILEKFSKILGGKFIYSEKTNRFHNGSVTLVPVVNKDLNKTMSIQGSCFMLTRDKYWELDICSEDFSSWGQQGVEVACKTWLSGGRLVVNKKTWYAHMFRTQGGDFSFPYEQSGRAIDKNRKYSRELFQGDKWPLAKHKFQWLIDRFAPVPDWHDREPSNKGIIYYTDNQLKVKIAKACQNKIKDSGLPIVSASLKPMDFGKNIHLPLKRGQLTMAKQVLAALEASKSEIVFFCEHDVLYHPSHFDFKPSKSDVFYYNQNVWRLRISDGFSVHYDCNQLSGLCCYRELAIKHYKEVVAKIEKEGWNRRMGFEPGTHDNRWEAWKSEYPNVDIRHEANLTKSKWSPADFRNKKYCIDWRAGYEIPHWGKGKDILS